MLNLVASLAQTNFIRVSCYFILVSTWSAVASGLNQESIRALDFSCFEMIGKEADFRTPMRGRGRRQTVFTGGAQRWSSFCERLESTRPADVTYLWDKPCASANVPAVGTNDMCAVLAACNDPAERRGFWPRLCETLWTDWGDNDPAVERSFFLNWISTDYCNFVSCDFGEEQSLLRRMISLLFPKYN